MSIKCVCVLHDVACVWVVSLFIQRTAYRVVHHSESNTTLNRAKQHRIELHNIGLNDTQSPSDKHTHIVWGSPVQQGETSNSFYFIVILSCDHLFEPFVTPQVHFVKSSYWCSSRNDWTNSWNGIKMKCNKRWTHLLINNHKYFLDIKETWMWNALLWLYIALVINVIWLSLLLLSVYY